MKFLTRWLGLERPGARVGLRPHRDLELALDYAAAYARCRAAIETVLGATVFVDDEKTGFIEAGFGLVNSERLRCTVSRIDDAHTAIRVEAFFPAGVDVPATSRNVEALAAALTGA
ncbi:MAG TPA: hypothetical protein VK760_13725 [Candidatus Acidoferrales bacterium]|jgi:hypothetical protein|nr:hypothetical protein [Candidatus Acidoferrales bacterium]